MFAVHPGPQVHRDLGRQDLGRGLGVVFGLCVGGSAHQDGAQEQQGGHRHLGCVDTAPSRGRYRPLTDSWRSR